MCVCKDGRVIGTVRFWKNLFVVCIVIACMAAACIVFLFKERSWVDAAGKAMCSMVALEMSSLAVVLWKKVFLAGRGE